MGRADVYPQPDAPDPVLPLELVRELCRPHLPGDLPPGTSMEVDESGGEARAYLLGDGVVVKTQRPHRVRPRTSLAKEAALLAALAAPLAGRIPTLYGYDTVDTTAGPVEFIVMSRVPGRAVGGLSLAGSARGALLGEVAAVLRTVHALDASGFASGGLLPTDTGVAALRARLEPNFADLADRLTDRPDSWPLEISPARVTELALGALPDHPGHAPAVLHSNPGPTHVFTDTAGTFRGLIDFGDAYASHPALDLRSWPDPEDRIRLRDQYLDGRSPAADWDRVWTVAMIYADMAALAGSAVHAARAASDLGLRLRRL